MTEEKTIADGLLKLLGAFALFILMLLYGALVGGLIVYKFYCWFILPVFTTLPKISFVAAVGLSMFKTMFYKIESKKEKTDWTVILVSPWLLLFVGWITYLIIK